VLGKKIETKMITKESLLKQIKIDENECWNFTGKIMSKGYGIINDSRVSKLAHRAMWELTFGPIPNGLFICHKCDNKLCINPDHLFTGTPADNTHDMMNKGRKRGGFKGLPGELSPCHKLTWSNVNKIRELIGQGVKNHVLAKMFNICSSQISEIKYNRAWRDNDVC
jgi:hypothetical protein